MIRTATEAIAGTLPLVTVAYEAERDADEQINELLPLSTGTATTKRQSAAGPAVEQPESTLCRPSGSAL